MTASMAYTSQLSLAGSTDVIIGAKAAKTAAEAMDPLLKAVRYMATIPIKNETAFVSLLPKGDALASNVRMSSILRPLNLFKGTAAANAALAGSTIILVAFAIIHVDSHRSVHRKSNPPDQSLNSTLLQAQQAVDLGQMFGQPNGSDLVIYYWAKAMEAEFVLEKYAGAGARSHRAAASTTKWIPVGDCAINFERGSGVGGQGSGVRVWSSSFSLLLRLTPSTNKLKLDLHTLTPDP